MKTFILALISVTLYSYSRISAQTLQPFLQETFENYSGGPVGQATGAVWENCYLSGDGYNQWIVDSTCALIGNKSLAVTSRLMNGCTYEDGDYSHAGSVIVYSGKIAISPSFKNVTLVFNWKSGGNTFDYGMLSYSLSGNYDAASYWTNVTNIYDGVANGKYYNRSAEQYASANLKEIATGDSIRIGFRWYTNQDGNVSAPGWIVDNLVLCALGEISSSMGDTIVPGIMTRLVLSGYTGTVVQWERYAGGQWIYEAGVTASYSTPINLPEGINKFRVKIQNGIQVTYAEKHLLVSSQYSVNEMNGTKDIFSISPNPGKSHFVVCNPQGKNFDITLFNSFGEPVYSFSFERNENSKDIDLSFLPAGIYYAAGRNYNQPYIQKIIISR